MNMHDVLNTHTIVIFYREILNALLWSHKDPTLEFLDYFQSFIIVCIYDYFVPLMDLLLFDFVCSYARMHI